MGGRHPRPGESPSQIQPQLTWTKLDCSGWGQLDLEGGGAELFPWKDSVFTGLVLLCVTHMGSGIGPVCASLHPPPGALTQGLLISHPRVGVHSGCQA